MGKRKIRTPTNNSLNSEITVDISADDQLRSQYMRKIIIEDNHEISALPKLAIPHLLVQFWDKAIPSDVQTCIDSWKPLEEHGFTHLLFDNEHATRFIEETYDNHYLDAFERCRHPAMRSDYFRLCFMLANGGAYIDADEVYKGIDLDLFFYDDKLKLQPLCYNSSTNSMIKIADFTANLYDLQKLIFYVNNNPLIAPPNHPVIYKALERATQMLLAQQGGDKQDIQSTTGPGNLTICLVRHALECAHKGTPRDFVLLTNWDEISVSQWPLDYRQDKRNWRLWDGCNGWE